MYHFAASCDELINLCLSCRECDAPIGEDYCHACINNVRWTDKDLNDIAALEG